MSQRFTVSNTNSLRDRSGFSNDRFGSEPTSGRSSPYHGNGYGASQRTAEGLESQNDEQIEGLGNKVKVLKELTIGIGNEIRDSTAQLANMNDAFSETGDILSGTFRRMNNMAQRQGCRWLWYIVFLVVVFWFFIVVWWFRR